MVWFKQTKGGLEISSISNFWLKESVHATCGLRNIIVLLKYPSRQKKKKQPASNLTISKFLDACTMVSEEPSVEGPQEFSLMKVPGCFDYSALVV